MTTPSDLALLLNSLPALFPPSIPVRAKFFITGIILPLSIFVTLCASDGPLANVPLQSWQSYDMHRCLLLLLASPSCLPHLPLAAMSAACLGTWVIKPGCSRWFLVRIGIYTGLILAIQFLVLLLLTTGWWTLLPALVGGPILAGIVRGFQFAGSQMHRFTIGYVLALTTVVAALIAAIKLSGTLELLFFILLGGAAIVVAASPTLAVITSLRASYWVKTEMRASVPCTYKRVICWVVWLVAWMMSWVLAITIMLEEFANPDIL